MSQFYDQHKNGSYLSNKFIHQLMVESLKEREIVKANENDIQRALVTLDRDNDEQINLDEFFQLLVLFFASKNNLKSRILSILTNSSEKHQNKGSLTESEATKFIQFLNKFYARQLDDDENSKTLFENGISYHLVADYLSQELAPFAYVQWQ